MQTLNVIFFIGPQGSGKGTQAKILANKLGSFYWEMGTILRETAKADTDLGKKVKEMVDNGILLPDELLYQVVETKLAQIHKNQGVIFDGIPRRLGQAEYLISFLKSQDRNNFTTILIDLPKEECLKRLLKRAKDQNRTDDSEMIINKRLEQYYQVTAPVIDYLKSHTNLIRIDGTPPINEIALIINRKLNI